MPSAVLPSLALLPGPWMALPPEATLTVQAAGFRDSRGQAVAKLFRPGENVRGRGHWEQAAPIREGQAQFRFPGLEPGAYAGVDFHDPNGHGVMDHQPLLRLPSEPLGFSNGFSLGLLSGPPTFENLRFELAGPGRSLDIPVE
ncbi:MAG: DUF2141 domain-containing protein [Acidobacteria bacterium]|nr:DUF2141 domain-containing protein [Acidobacteriota bacterium]